MIDRRLALFQFYFEQSAGHTRHVDLTLPGNALYDYLLKAGSPMNAAESGLSAICKQPNGVHLILRR